MLPATIIAYSTCDHDLPFVHIKLWFLLTFFIIAWSISVKKSLKMCKKSFFMKWNVAVQGFMSDHFFNVCATKIYTSFEYFDTLSFLFFTNKSNRAIYARENFIVDEGKSPAAKSNKNMNENRTQIKMLLSVSDGLEREFFWWWYSAHFKKKV